jgi:2-polyprenyl-6-methoxyphenol hydroxylase-like FAD-dependent oxidoreductase
MSSSSSPVVVVVGGGPAGLAAAVALGKEGVQVIVIERGTWPRDKVCGEGLMPVGVDALKKLDVFSKLDPQQRRPFRGIRWISDDGATAEADFASGPGFGIRRTALSQALFDAASAIPWVKLWPRTRLTALEVCDDHVEISVKRESGTEKVRAQLVIGADGRNSKVRKLTNMEGKPAVSLRRWGARQHFATRPWTEHVEVWWSDGIEAYVTPSGDQQVEIAFLWDKAKYSPKRKGRELVAGLLEEFPALKARLGDEAPPTLSPSAGIGPLAWGSSQSVSHRVVLIGDALGYVDGITGEGISVALSQVQELQARLPKLIASDQLTKDALRPLGKSLSKLFAETVPLVRAALLLTQFPSLRRLAVRGLSNSRSLFVHLLEANMGTRPLYKIPVVGLLRFLWGALRPRSRAPHKLRRLEAGKGTAL